MIQMGTMLAKDDEGELVEVAVPALNRQTNEPIVTETRASAPWRALPRPVRDRVVSLEESKKFLVRYQEYVGAYQSGVRCWKCGTPIVAWQPALRAVKGSRSQQDGELVKITANGQTMILGSLLPLNHYREGLASYLTRQKTLAKFSYLHCADCAITSADCEDLLACLLGGFEHQREILVPHLSLPSANDWAQTMYRWSGVELVGLDGPSKGPVDLRNEAQKGPS